MRTLGFNVVRLGLLWQAHEVERGVYNTSYLRAVGEVVDVLAAEGKEGTHKPNQRGFVSNPFG